MATHTADTLHLNEIIGFLRSALAGAGYGGALDVGIVCGSGLSNLSASIEGPLSIPYASIPHFPRSTVQGHGTELVFGRLGGKLVAAARGRFHYYEGHSYSALGILPRVFAALGAKVAIVTNAAGGVNPNFNVGDIMVIADHLNLPGMAGIHPLIGANDARFGPRFPAVTNTYSAELQALAATLATELGLEQYLRQGGVYSMVSGPSYETRHEIAALRLLGADAVGMSTVPEVVAAAHCGMSVIGLSLITNKCVAPGDTTVPPTHEEVLSVTDARAHDVQRLVSTLVARMDLAAFPVPLAATSFAGVTAPPPGAEPAGTAAVPVANPTAAPPAEGVATPWSDALGHSGGADAASVCPFLKPHAKKATPGSCGAACAQSWHHGPGTRCPYTFLTSALRCPPIACALGAAAGVAAILALQAHRGRALF